MRRPQTAALATKMTKQGPSHEPDYKLLLGGGLYPIYIYIYISPKQYIYIYVYIYIPPSTPVFHVGPEATLVSHGQKPAQALETPHNP